MDTKEILQNYLLCANISEYRGPTRSLVELIYWAIGEIVCAQNIERLFATNTHIENYSLTIQEKGSRAEVRIVKMNTPPSDGHFDRTGQTARPLKSYTLAAGQTPPV